MVPTPTSLEWTNWIQELHFLENVRVSRCFKPVDFGAVASSQLHNFADASKVGYGTATYSTTTQMKRCTQMRCPGHGKGQGCLKNQCPFPDWS